MTLLEYENNRDNYRRNITHGQPIGKKNLYRPIRESKVLMVIFIKQIFMIGYLI